ncbi:hypothetical protein F4782DRAFT_533768 [Xylaria castorea]|nr:hypothetical protein F4782DRAFT_533768 [Xylaria castorea]
MTATSTVVIAGRLLWPYDGTKHNLYDRLSQTFSSADCSGATVVNIKAEPQGNNSSQMDMVGSPQMMTYHAGGNNYGFDDVVSHCINQPGTGYGPEYPDPSGVCAQQLAKSNSYINNGGEHGLYGDELKTVIDGLGHPAVQDDTDFRLYIQGYAHFLNLGANYYDGISFGPLISKLKLSNRLRADVNDGVEHSPVRFLDISPAFNGHRFFENNHSYKDQRYSTDVWLWNLDTPSGNPPADPSRVDAWLDGAYLPDGAPLPDYPNTTTFGVEMQGGIETEGTGETQAIADTVIAQALADRIPGVLGS